MILYPAQKSHLKIKQQSFTNVIHDTRLSEGMKDHLRLFNNTVSDTVEYLHTLSICTQLSKDVHRQLSPVKTEQLDHWSSKEFVFKNSSVLL